MSRTIDLSCDLGEAATAADIEVEAGIWPLITSANIACGGHTGDETTMRRAVEMALRYGVAVGAHPSYPDREHFGRRTLAIEPARLLDSLRRQLESLRDVTNASPTRLTHVKPHGALYNDAHHDRELSSVILDAIEAVDAGIAVVCGPGSMLQAEAADRGIRVVTEGFADRRYARGGSLVSRSRSEALLLEPAEAAEQACTIVLDSQVVSDDGTETELHAETLCIHSDMPRSPERLRAIRAALEQHGVTFRSVHAR